MDEQKVNQLFRNRANCYADADDVIQAMDENCFIETVNEALRLFAVSGQLPNNLILYRQAKKLDYAEFCKWINAKVGNLR